MCVAGPVLAAGPGRGSGSSAAGFEPRHRAGGSHGHGLGPQQVSGGLGSGQILKRSESTIQQRSQPDQVRSADAAGAKVSRAQTHWQ